MTALRPYQRQAIDSLLQYWENGGGNGLVEMATGVGKSVVIAAMVKELLEQYPTLRILMLVHVRELVGQNLQALLRLWPQAPVGLNSAGLGRRDTNHQVLFASIQSIYKKGKSLGVRDLVLVDECHLMPHDGEGMYRRLLSDLDAPDGMRVAGFTATAYRLSSGRLDEGKGRLFDKTVYSYGIAQGIEEGFLSPLIGKATATAIDVSGVSRRGGEFVSGALESAVDKDWITKAAVDEIIQFGVNRRSWLAFCSGIKHANHVADEIKSRGISCEVVSGETPTAQRDRILRDFKAGRIRCLTNAMVLTTGFDAPEVDLIAMLRPTLSPGLYVQICGRGTRLAQGKENCLVLDFAGNVKRHGPVDAIEVKGKGAGKGESVDSVKAKECPNCKSLVALASRTCPVCAFEWPFKEEAPKHEATADASSSILSKGAPAWIDVDAVRHYVHRKDGSPDSVRVEYHCGFTTHKEWVCFSHQGMARSKAEMWWKRTAGTAIPRTTEEALTRVKECRRPVAIQVRPSGRYFEVVGRRYPELAEAAE